MAVTLPKTPPRRVREPLQTPPSRLQDAFKTGSDYLNIDKKIQNETVSLHRRSKTLPHASNTPPRRCKTLHDAPKTRQSRLLVVPTRLQTPNSFPISLKTSSGYSMLQYKYRSSSSLKAYTSVAFFFMGYETLGTFHTYETGYETRVWNKGMKHRYETRMKHAHEISGWSKDMKQLHCGDTTFNYKAWCALILAEQKRREHHYNKNLQTKTYYLALIRLNGMKHVWNKYETWYETWYETSATYF